MSARRTITALAVTATAVSALLLAQPATAAPSGICTTNGATAAGTVDRSGVTLFASDPRSTVTITQGRTFVLSTPVRLPRRYATPKLNPRLDTFGTLRVSRPFRADWTCRFQLPRTA